MEKKRIGKGYQQKGYGRGFNKNAVIWLIDGKAYARDLRGWKLSMFALTDELEGYVRVNKFGEGTEFEDFIETNSNENHKLFNVEKLNFENTRPIDLSWLEREELIDIIFNTFESKIISDNPKWTTIESDWKMLSESEYDLIGNDFLKNKTFKIYFHIYTPKKSEDKFVIIRGSTPDEISKFVKFSQKKNPKVIDRKYGNYENGNSFSTILEGRYFSRLFWAFKPIPNGKDFIMENGKFISLQNMLCDVDLRMGGKNLGYFSDLLIGLQIQIENKK